MQNDAQDFADGHHLELAAAFCRGRLGLSEETQALDAVRQGLAEGLRLHKFKRTSTLPRVKRALGMLKGLAPTNLLDIGSGRGTFLWPLLTEFPELPVTALDFDPRRASDLQAAARGGLSQLSVRCEDILTSNLERGHADVVTALEVLEHIAEAERAARELLRLARRAIVVSVPSKPDNNPEHIQLFGRESLRRLFLEAGARKVEVDFVLNHMLALVWVS